MSFSLIWDVIGGACNVEGIVVVGCVLGTEGAGAAPVATPWFWMA
jgi:hypothetical protein